MKTSQKRALVWYCSAMIPWIDFAVVVSADAVETVIEAIDKAMDKFWIESDLCYGDLVEAYLNDTGIDYEIAYHDSDREDDEYEEMWSAYLDELFECAHCVEKYILI